MATYTKGVGDFIKWLKQIGYDEHTIRETALGYGDSVFTQEGKKSIVILQKSNEMHNTPYSIVKYNVLPKKYKKVLAIII